MPRTKKFNESRKICFNIEQNEFDKLEVDMKEDNSFLELSNYIRYIIERRNDIKNFEKLKRLFELGKVKVYDNKLTHAERDFLNEI